MPSGVYDQGRDHENASFCDCHLPKLPICGRLSQVDVRCTIRIAMQNHIQKYYDFGSVALS